MAKQVPWNKDIVERFSELAMLSEEEKFIVETRAKGWSVSKQAQALNCSESTIAKRISVLKKKYDKVQQNDNLLPPRRTSAQETWMDTH